MRPCWPPIGSCCGCLSWLLLPGKARHAAHALALLTERSPSGLTRRLSPPSARSRVRARRDCLPAAATALLRLRALLILMRPASAIDIHSGSAGSGREHGACELATITLPGRFGELPQHLRSQASPSLARNVSHSTAGCHGPAGAPRRATAAGMGSCCLRLHLDALRRRQGAVHARRGAAASRPAGSGRAGHVQDPGHRRFVCSACVQQGCCCRAPRRMRMHAMCYSDARALAAPPAAAAAAASSRLTPSQPPALVAAARRAARRAQCTTCRPA